MRALPDYQAEQSSQQHYSERPLHPQKNYLTIDSTTMMPGYLCYALAKKLHNLHLAHGRDDLIA